MRETKVSGFGVRGTFPCVWWPYAREKDPKLPLVYVKLMKAPGKLMAERVKHWACVHVLGSLGEP